MTAGSYDAQSGTITVVEIELSDVDWVSAVTRVLSAHLNKSLEAELLTQLLSVRKKKETTAFTPMVHNIGKAAVS